MSALHQLLARAEAHVAVCAVEVANIGRHREQLKEIEKGAVRDHRQAQGLVTRLRGVIEAAVILPDEDEAADPVFVPISETLEPVTPFTPALDYPDSHPVEIPKRIVEEPILPVGEALPEETRPEPSNVREIPLTSGMLAAVTAPPIPNEPAHESIDDLTPLQERVLGFLDANRGSSPYASVEIKAVCERFKTVPSKLNGALTALADAGLIQRVKASKTTEPGWATFKVLATAVKAA